LDDKYNLITFDIWLFYGYLVIFQEGNATVSIYYFYAVKTYKSYIKTRLELNLTNTVMCSQSEGGGGGTIRYLKIKVIGQIIFNKVNH
jgi:hypothetical protein